MTVLYKTKSAKNGPIYKMLQCHAYIWAKIKITCIFVSPYLTNPKKIAPTQSILLQFFIQDYVFLFFLITERQKFHVLEGYIV